VTAEPPRRQGFAASAVRATRWLAASSLAVLLAGCGVEANEDPLAPALRSRVAALIEAEAKEPFTPQNYAERVGTLWEWSNAFALADLGQLPVMLPRHVAEARAAAASGKPPEARLLQWLDADVRELAIKDADPDATGEVRFASSEPLAAGSWAEVSQTWTVGSRPLVAGGKVVIGRQLATDQAGFQADDPAGDNYVSIRASDPAARFRVTKAAIPGIHGAYRGSPPPVAFELEPGAVLDRGETVTVVYGDRRGGSRGFHVQTFATDELLLPLYLDLDGSGLELSPRWPHLAVVGGGASGVVALAPSVVAVGEAFDLVLRTEDARWSRATGRIPGYQVKLRDRVMARVPAGGAAVTRVAGLHLDAPGTYRFEVVADADGIEATSNPIWVESKPDRRILWGETHVHAGLSEGQGSAEAVFRYAREDARLDFLGYSEHDVWMDDSEWRTLDALARRYGEDGELVTFLGYEWTADREQGGHHNVFFRTPGRRRVAMQDAPLLADLYRGLAQANRPEDVLVIPHAHMPGDWTQSDPALERLVEIYSMHGSFEWFGNLYLKRGWRVGFIGASDEHRAMPGHSPGFGAFGPLLETGGVAAVIAPAKTRDAIFDALRGFSSYGTSGQRILLDARLDGHPMGTRQDAPVKRHVEVRAAGTSPIDRIDLVRDGEVVYSRRYLGVPLDATSSWLEVAFESSSEALGPVRDSPRPTRVWQGTLEVEGARVLDSATPGLDNRYEERFTRDEADPNRFHFRVLTRGRGDTVLLRVAGANAATTLRFALDATDELSAQGGEIRKPAHLPAQEVTLRLAELVDGRLEHELPVDVHVDRIALQVVDPGAPLDQAFEFTDTAPPGAAAYYYVRVTQLDGGRAWSSPFWVGGSDPARAQ
jgi:hypothetical protein